MIAAAGINLAERITGQVNVASPVWSAEVAQYIGFVESELEPCMREMHSFLVKEVKEDTLKAVTRLFMHLLLPSPSSPCNVSLTPVTFTQHVLTLHSPK